MSERVSVFVNGDNLYSFQNRNFWVDPKLFLGWIEQEYGTIVDAFYYLNYDADNDGQNKFLGALPHFGYIPVAHPVIKHELEPIVGVSNPDEPEYEYERFNLSMDITCDLLSTINNYDRAVFAFMSEEFTRPIKILRDRGKAVSLIAGKGYAAHNVLSLFGRNYVDINTIRKRVERKDRHRGVPEFSQRN